jgi:hypothetical protein
MSAPHLIFTVKWGPQNGRKAALAPGQSLRLGRGELADLVVPNDAQLAAVHCELGWDGQRGTFRDLEGARATVHNGAAGAGAGELRHGDWIKAGETTLTVHLEGATPPPFAAPAGDAQEAHRLAAREARRAARAQEALATLREMGRVHDGGDPQTPATGVYAVLDAARDRRILQLCREAVEEHHSLYDGVQGETLAEVAPYLVRLDAGSRLLGALVREGWGRRWGIYLTSARPFAAVRRHLRRYLMALREDDHERLYFRFYDPAVLGVFLGVTRALQRSELFAEIDAFAFEDEGGAVTVARAAGEG